MLSSEPIKVWPRIRKLTNERLLAIHLQLDHGCFVIYHRLPSCTRISMHRAVGSSPIRRPEVFSIDFPRGRLWNFHKEFDGFGSFYTT